jgi:hypothetical protein
LIFEKIFCLSHPGLIFILTKKAFKIPKQWGLALSVLFSQFKGKFNFNNTHTFSLSCIMHPTREYQQSVGVNYPKKFLKHV